MKPNYKCTFVALAHLWLWRVPGFWEFSAAGQFPSGGYRDCTLLPVSEALLEARAVPVSGLQDKIGSQLLCGAMGD